MAKAKEILAERLARGEITEDEYDRLLGKLVSEANKTSRLQTPVDKETKSGLIKLGIVAAVLFGIFTAYSSLKSGRTHVNNLRASGFFGDVVSGELLTEGKSGSIYVWVEKGGKIMCPRSVFLQKGRPRRFEFQCSAMSKVKGSRFRLITNRIADDWIKKNAKSL